MDIKWAYAFVLVALIICSTIVLIDRASIPSIFTTIFSVAAAGLFGIDKIGNGKS